MPRSLTRCAWVGTDVLMQQYHDREWGVPVHDDRQHFEFLVLEAAQAGLSWSIVLKKRDGYRLAFSDFDVARVARYTDARIERLVTNPAIIRNRQKIVAAVRNAKAFMQIQKAFGSFDTYAWQFVGGRPNAQHNLVKGRDVADVLRDLPGEGLVLRADIEEVTNL